MNKPRIGILYTERTSLTPYKLRIFSYGTAITVEPGHKFGFIDGLIIPDKIGAYIGMQCFARVTYGALGLRKMCNYSELFRLDQTGLDYYTSKQIPILGVGDGRVMLWNKLGGIATVNYGGTIELIDNKSLKPVNISYNEDRFVQNFQVNNYFGCENINSDVFQMFLNYIREVYLKDEPVNPKPKRKSLTITL